MAPTKGVNKGITSEDVKPLVDKAGLAPDAPAAPAAPSFGMCEGTREELARLGVATDPFTGAKLTEDDLPA